MLSVSRTFRTVAIIGLTSVVLTSCTFSRFARKGFERAAKAKPYDAIIVPGLPYDKDNTSSVLTMRMNWAKYLYDSGYTRNVIFSGAAVYTPFVESVAMKVIADSMGIPSKYTFAETEAEHSTENVYYSWKMAQGLGFEKIALATDPFQARMLKPFVKKHTPGVDIVPVIFDKIEYTEKELPRIDTTAAYQKNFVSIKERESFFERIRFTFGKRIKDEKKLEARQRKQESRN